MSFNETGGSGTPGQGSLPGQGSSPEQHGTPGQGSAPEQSDIALAASRKEDHIRYALQQQAAAAGRTGTSGPGERGSAPHGSTSHRSTPHNDFLDIEFLHHALSGINLADVDLGVEVAGMRWQTPLYINAMTGGTDTALHINTVLAEACAATGVAIGSGSVGMALDDPDCAASFRVLRERNPDGLVFANIGAGRPVDHALRAVDLLAADALQVHVNAVQETVMPEGGRDFGNWLPLLAEIVERVQVPVIVKEVGCGLSVKTLRQLAEIGVTVADVSGTGGTSFAAIEAARRSDSFTDLNDFGQSAVCCLLDAAAAQLPLTLLASGGVKTPLDVVKAVALGATGVGVAGSVLPLAVSGDAENVTEHLKWMQQRTKELFALLGANSVSAARHCDVLIRGRVREYCELRGINAQAYAQRS